MTPDDDSIATPPKGGASMTRKYLAFDIEIAKPLPDGCTDWKAHRPLGISCAATWASDENEPIVWFSEEEGDFGLWRYAACMNHDDLDSLASYLGNMAFDGYTLLTHNGTSFDWDILAEETGLVDHCRKWALNHVDTMFHFFSLRGHPVSLDALAKGMQVLGKKEGMNGAQAPQMWAEGRYQEVLAYVAQDVRCTLDVALECEQQAYIRWITKAGAPKAVVLQGGWKTVRECLTMPEVDNDWMTNPMRRERFTEWMTVP